MNFPQIPKGRGKKTLKMVAAKELKAARQGSKVDEMLKKAEADDVSAFGRLGGNSIGKMFA